MEKEIMNVVSEDANEVIVEVAEEFIPDVTELKKLGLIVTGIVVVGGATVVIFKKAKVGTKLKNLVKKIPLFRKNKDVEAETAEEN